MSSQSQLSEFDLLQIPEFGVRSRSRYAESLHLQDTEHDEPFPACRTEISDDTEFKEVRIESYLPVNRWHLCRDCFPDQEGSR